MLEPVVRVQLDWKPGNDPALCARLAEECQAIAWPLSEMEALLLDAHRLTALDHAYLMPRIELRVPLYDLGRRFRVVFTHIERVRIALVDEDGKKLADLTLH